MAIKQIARTIKDETFSDPTQPDTTIGKVLLDFRDARFPLEETVQIFRRLLRGDDGEVDSEVIRSKIAEVWDFFD